MVANFTCRKRHRTHGNVLNVKNSFRVNSFEVRTYVKPRKPRKLKRYAKNARRNVVQCAVDANRYIIAAWIVKRRTGQGTREKTVQSDVENSLTVVDYSATIRI